MITGRTAVIAIIADPVAQARAPVLMNAALERRGRDAVLVPLHVDAAGFPAVVGALRAMKNLRGAIVSMPHKSTLVELLDEPTPEAREVGAANVVRREADGRLVGTMMDGEGFVAGLRAAGHEVRGRRVFLAGAGGAAAGIAFAVARHGAVSLTIHNRTASKAGALAARVGAAFRGGVAVGVGSAPHGHDLVVNATSLGMRDGDPLPLDVGGLEAGAVAAEVVIQPETTPFLAEAARRGCIIHPGQPMLAAQIELMIDFMGA